MILSNRFGSRLKSRLARMEKAKRRNSHARSLDERIKALVGKGVLVSEAMETVLRELSDVELDKLFYQVEAYELSMPSPETSSAVKRRLQE